MSGPKPPAFETLGLHAGQHPDPVTGARAVPIYQTTSFVFQDADHAAGFFNPERAGHIYTRISNPTTAVLEERLAALAGGLGPICTASGMAALHLALPTPLYARGPTAAPFRQRPDLRQTARVGRIPGGDQAEYPPDHRRNHWQSRSRSAGYSQ